MTDQAREPRPTGFEQVLAHPPQHILEAPPIKVVDVTVRFDGTTALDQVSFRVPQAEKVAVVGPNGAGKTTLLKVLSGILAPSSGDVQVYGYGPASHVCIAYVPQRSQVDWRFPVSVADVVMMGRIKKLGLLRWPSRPDWDVVDNALERVGMTALRDRHIRALSGGQQQRVFLARALAQEAEIVLLDEPLTGLDAPTQEAILALLDELKNGGVPSLVATHDLTLAGERFDRVLLLNRALVSQGSPEVALTRQALESAYGASMHLLPLGNGALVLTDFHAGEKDDE